VYNLLSFLNGHAHFSLDITDYVFLFVFIFGFGFLVMKFNFLLFFLTKKLESIESGSLSNFLLSYNIYTHTKVSDNIVNVSFVAFMLKVNQKSNELFFLTF